MNDVGLFILRAVAGGYVMKYGLPKLRDVDASFAKEFQPRVPSGPSVR